jgi:hypothetical protein
MLLRIKVPASQDSRVKMWTLHVSVRQLLPCMSRCGRCYPACLSAAAATLHVSVRQLLPCMSQCGSCYPACLSAAAATLHVSVRPLLPCMSRCDHY